VHCGQVGVVKKRVLSSSGSGEIPEFFLLDGESLESTGEEMFYIEKED
jgi:hypothetical protein